MSKMADINEAHNTMVEQQAQEIKDLKEENKMARDGMYDMVIHNTRITSKAETDYIKLMAENEELKKENANLDGLLSSWVDGAETDIYKRAYLARWSGEKVDCFCEDELEQMKKDEGWYEAEAVDDWEALKKKYDWDHPQYDGMWKEEGCPPSMK
jgi:hypothetical protein